MSHQVAVGTQCGRLVRGDLPLRVGTAASEARARMRTLGLAAKIPDGEGEPP
jgi:hypothetical protein